MTSSRSIATLLEMAAVDNGFDRELPQLDGWLAFASTQAPLHVWLRPRGGGTAVALSQLNVADALDGHGDRLDIARPPGAEATIVVASQTVLYRLLRRAFQLSKTLPDELLHQFQKATVNLPRATEAERLVVQRVGQDVFRAGLLRYWEGRCALTGLAVPDLLLASHIKPWTDCETDAERLDAYNGILLGPNLDRAFDKGFFTIQDDGFVVVSSLLPDDARKLIGLDAPLRVERLRSEHQRYLAWHRSKVFRRKVIDEPKQSDKGHDGE